MKPALLDTNVLLALTWPNHQFHREASAWFSAEARQGWATCALTQLGFIRLSSNKSYTPAPVAPAAAAMLLRKLIALPGHRFWPSPAADDPRIYAQALGHQQVNDAWLVEAARQGKGRLVTLDTRLPVHAPEKDLVFVIKTKV